MSTPIPEKSKEFSWSPRVAVRFLHKPTYILKRDCMEKNAWIKSEKLTPAIGRDNRNNRYDPTGEGAESPAETAPSREVLGVKRAAFGGNSVTGGLSLEVGVFRLKPNDHSLVMIPVGSGLEHGRFQCDAPGGQCLGGGDVGERRQLFIRLEAVGTKSVVQNVGFRRHGFPPIRVRGLTQTPIRG